jgi:hypothetical protein
LNLGAGIISGVLALYAFGLKQANASGSNFFELSRGNQVSASSSHVEGKWPLRVI